MATGTEGIVITFSDMAAATGGRILFPARISRGSLPRGGGFARRAAGQPLRRPAGERTDGHEFLGQAAAAGAAAMIVSEAQAGRRTARLRALRPAGSA